jgi:hypothetical protein
MACRDGQDRLASDREGAEACILRQNANQPDIATVLCHLLSVLY